MKTDLKTLREYNVIIKLPFEVSTKWQTVMGYRVIIVGFEEYSFFVHHSINTFNEKWRVSEASTGFAFPSNCDGFSRQEAIDRATKLLSEKGKDKFAIVLEKAQLTIPVEETTTPKKEE